MKAYLMLEDGSVYYGKAAGKFKETVCEIVFNTSMTGYVEILSDPTYRGQGVVMSYPIIGNYGVNEADFESEKLQPCAFMVHEMCDTPSNFRNEMTLNELLIKYDIPCITGLDTRAIVKKLRESGTMKGFITADISDKDALMDKIKSFHKENPVSAVTADKPYTLSEGDGAKIALIDFGARKSIGEALITRGCAVTVYPASITADEIIKTAPDGIVLSNGPGDPAECVSIIKEIKMLCESGIPMFGIGLGHQLAALANGGKTEKMKYGHRGANHPVKFLNRDRTYITSQNHGYVVSSDELPENAEIGCINVNDSTVEGLIYHGMPVFTVQFHPEVNSGPGGTSFLYDKFLKMVKEGRYDD